MQKINNKEINKFSSNILNKILSTIWLSQQPVHTCSLWTQLIKNIIISYRISTVSAGSCLYAHIYVCNIINDTITLRITSTSGSKECDLKSYTTSWLDQNLANRALKQLSDGASTTS